MNKKQIKKEKKEYPDISQQLSLIVPKCSFIFIIAVASENGEM